MQVFEKSSNSQFSCCKTKAGRYVGIDVDRKQVLMLGDDGNIYRGIHAKFLEEVFTNGRYEPVDAETVDASDFTNLVIEENKKIL